MSTSAVLPQRRRQQVYRRRQQRPRNAAALHSGASSFSNAAWESAAKAAGLYEDNGITPPHLKSASSTYPSDEKSSSVAEIVRCAEKLSLAASDDEENKCRKKDHRKADSADSKIKRRRKDRPVLRECDANASIRAGDETENEIVVSFPNRFEDDDKKDSFTEAPLDSKPTPHDSPRPEQPQQPQERKQGPRTRVERYTDPYAAHTAPILRLCASPKARQGPVSFADWGREIERAHFDIVKIAEASYGEVYRLKKMVSRDNFEEDDKGVATISESVIKIVAIKPPPEKLVGQCNSNKSQVVNEQPQQRRSTRTIGAARVLTSNSQDGSLEACKESRKKESSGEDDIKEDPANWMSTPEHLAAELRLLCRLTPVPGFALFRDARVLVGSPPLAIKRSYREFNARKRAQCRARGVEWEGSQFPDPWKRGAYEETQLWCAIEMGDAGEDLEEARFCDNWPSSKNVDEEEGEECQVPQGNVIGGGVHAVWDIFFSVAIALAKAESAARFEHRDLHLGNVCVRLKEAANDENHRPRGSRKLGFCGLEVTIIDYTLSRADMQDNRDKEASEQDEPRDTVAVRGEEVAFMNLSEDPEIFNGDAAVEYQYEVYRMMRRLVFSAQDTASSDLTADTTAPLGPADLDRAKAKWHAFNPVTNALWLHFLLSSLLGRLHAEALEHPYGGETKDKDECPAWMVALPPLPVGMPVERARRRAARLMDRLERLGGMLVPASMGVGIGAGEEVEGKVLWSGAGSVVAFALAKGWIAEEDVV